MYPLLSVQCCIWSAASQKILNEDGEIDWGLAIGEGMFSAVMAGIVWEYGGSGERRGVEEREILNVQEKGIIINTSNKGPDFGRLNPLDSLNKRQRKLLEQLSNPGDTVLIHKRSVSMNDLRQLTSVTGDEFNMFTNGSQRLIIRGVGREIEVTRKMFDDLVNGVYGKFSGHTHPPGYSMDPGPKDPWLLKTLDQEKSSVWGYDGDGWLPFGQEPWLTEEIRVKIRREKWQKMYQ